MLLQWRFRWRTVAPPCASPVVSHSRGSRQLFWTLLACGLGLAPVRPACAALEPSQVAILINRDSGMSSKVASMYEQLRAIPASNVLRLSLGAERQITGDQYWKAANSVKNFLDAHAEIRCIVTTSGVPYAIRLSGDSDSDVAFDSELAAVLRIENGNRQTRLPNPLYINGANPYGITDPRLLKMIFVVRLDGPDLKTITRMVEDAIAAEQSGFQGPVFGDSQGSEVITGSGIGDASIRQAIDVLSGAGFQATLDLRPETWTQPANGIGNQAAGAAFYVGWYRLRDFQNIFGAKGLARGSIAWHIASSEAVDLWNRDERGWCVNLLRHGAAVTLGPVREPYLQAFPHGDIFLERLLSGESVAEGYWLSLPNISWAIVILGDPLYRPFGVHPRPSLMARAYIADNPAHILKKSETSSLLIALECVGPAGSATPALTAYPEPEVGLAAADGVVKIPALEAGQIALVRIPSVTAGNNPQGLFRLRLNVQTEGEQFRRIVVEGRIGFSRLTWGIMPKSQMFVSPNGRLLISGQPGQSALINVDTLGTQLINSPKGTGVVGAVFSPEGSRIALRLLDPQQRKESVVIVDSQLGTAQPLPPGSHFLRWIDKTRILVEDQNRYLSYSVVGEPNFDVQVPAGWSASIIHGTDFQFLHQSDGAMAIRKNGAPLYQVLQGTGVNSSIAVADDLSALGGVDGHKRLWIQRGINAQPKVVAEGVERVLWGPVSHVALVQTSNGQSRVYDTRDESWLALGVVSVAQWSPDERRLLFVQASTSSGLGTLTLLADRKLQPLYDLNTIGPIRGMAFAGNDRAFLLAELTGEVAVWMMGFSPVLN